MKWLSLLTNEWIKIFSRVRTWFFITIPILIIIGVAVYDKVATDVEVNENWKQELTLQIEDDKKALEEARKNDDDEFYIEMLETNIKQNEYAIKNDISPYESSTTWQFMKEMAPISSLIGLFVIVVASDIVSSEFSKGTIKMLLIRPYSRWKILLSKLLATLGFAFVMWLVVIVSSWLVGGLAYGFGGIDQTYLLHTEDGQIKEKLIVEYVFANIGLEFIELTVLVALSFMISTLFMSNSVAIGVAMFTMFAGNTIVMLLANKDWIIYTLFANMNLSVLIDNQNQLIEDLTLPFSISVLAIYSAVMLAITFTVFQKRDVKA